MSTLVSSCRGSYVLDKGDNPFTHGRRSCECTGYAAYVGDTSASTANTAGTATPQQSLPQEMQIKLSQKSFTHESVSRLIPCQGGGLRMATPLHGHLTKFDDDNDRKESRARCEWPATARAAAQATTIPLERKAAH